MLKNRAHFVLANYSNTGLPWSVLALHSDTPLEKLTFSLPVTITSSSSASRKLCALLTSLCWNFIWLEFAQVLCTLTQPL